MELKDTEFKKLSQLIYDRFGIHLASHKQGMMAARLNKIVNKLNIISFDSYYDYVLNDTTGRAASDLINAIATNHTFFNREKEHFDFFIKVSLPEILAILKEQNSRDIRVWSAGCSSGEEPYMLVMLMMEYFGKEYGLWDAGVLATDISEKVLNMARSGVYPLERVHSLNPQIKLKYFTKVAKEQFKISSTVAKEVIFRRLNLMNTVFPFKKKFHAIFCRNVMIYFDQKTRNELIRRFWDNLEPGGYFFIGHSETLGRNNEIFNYVMPAVYQKKRK